MTARKRNRATTVATNKHALRADTRARSMQAVMLGLDGFGDREIGAFLGMTGANVTRIRLHTDAPLRIGAILLELAKVGLPAHWRTNQILQVGPRQVGKEPLMTAVELLGAGDWPPS